MVSYHRLLSGRARGLDRSPILMFAQQFSVTFDQNIMIFQIFFLFFLSHGIRGENTNNTTAKVTVAPTQGNMCQVCTCTDGIVNCSSRNLEDHFEDDNWPTEPLLEVSFAKNSFVHVRAFPKVSVNRLILRENSINTIDEGAFLELRNLTELDLSHNQLTTPLLGPHVFRGRFSPVAYEPLPKMKVLNLAYNALHSLHRDLFEHLGSLTVLSLEGNPFENIDDPTVDALSYLSYLEELTLSYCDLDDLPEHVFHTPKFLKRVDLTGNKFSSPPLALEDGRALEWVALDENPIKVINENNAFPIMANLKELSLCCMHNLTAIGAGAFSGLTGLEVLHIEGCPQLEVIDENALASKHELGTEWPPLKKLQLADNALHYLPAKLIGRWDKLVDLDLHNNKWGCDCKNQFLVESLLPSLGDRLMGENANDLTCSTPQEHEGKNLTSLSTRHLRCVDLYNARPERDATVLVGILIGVLLAVPVTLAVFVFWRRGFFFYNSQGPATFSRAFYKRADRDEDF
ncbi:leucine-rich repeat neuronal protein 1-like [Neodiprion virginianus]|uniref:leucine-rich repeat neuronal protein 1-like n=1 Tax=Neodiprion virginianus TaxID=2961670 RepID=UPI001EE73313|nr:leucine-rich repeat neuronal protein 1-like [Neodiprion virginianus]